MKVFLIGGGTGGPTAPLVSVAEAILAIKLDAEFFFIGTRATSELDKKIFAGSKIAVKNLTIPAGKWRRYFSLRNFYDIFKIAFGFFKSVFLIKKYKPDIIFGAGSFVQVPLMWAGFVSRIPVVAHQQDLDPLLSTRLVAPVARALTFSFSTTGKEFPEGIGLFKRENNKSKMHLTGNPVRKLILKGSVTQARKIFGLNKDYPTVLVLGGGGGAQKLNEVIVQSLPELVKYVQIIHSTGGRDTKTAGRHPHYHAYEFIPAQELSHAYAAADLVISRGGMSTITELSVLGKPAILVPLPQSPQEDNVRLLAVLKSAVGVFEEFLTPDLLLQLVRKILWNRDLQTTLSHNIKKVLPPDADKKIAKIICQIADQKSP